MNEGRIFTVIEVHTNTYGEQDIVARHQWHLDGTRADAEKRAEFMSRQYPRTTFHIVNVSAVASLIAA